VNLHYLLPTLFIFSVFTALNAQALEATDAKALQQTQDVLTDQAKRKNAVNSSEKGKQADAYATSVVGAKNTDEVYALAAKVMERLVQKYNGDAGKISEVLERAKNNPAGFASSEFTAEELNALKALSQKIEPAGPSAK
jgi:hypothetical protein